MLIYILLNDRVQSAVCDPSSRILTRCKLVNSTFSIHRFSADDIYQRDIVKMMTLLQSSFT